MGEITTKLTLFRIDKFKQILKQKLSTEILLFILHLKCIIFLPSHYLCFTRLAPLCTLVKNVLFSVDDSVRARRVYSQKIIILGYHIKIIP